MSCDTSDPRILEAYRDVQTPGIERDWLLMSYSKTGSPSTEIVLDKSGAGGVAGLKKALESSDEEVHFGLVSKEGHELLVTYVSEAVTGVRRARTIVHSRAVAKLFPDHHSSLTITHPSELTDEATRQRLNIDEAQSQHYQQQVQAHHRAVSNGSTIRSRVEGQPSSRSIAADAHHGQEVLNGQSHPEHHSDQLPALPAPSPPPSPPKQTMQAPVAEMSSVTLGPPITSSLGVGAAPQGRSVSSGAAFHQNQSPQISHPSPISVDQRRIVSTSAVPPAPPSPSEQPPTPTNSSSRFKNMIPKFARRRRRSSSSQTGSQPGSMPNSPNPAQTGFGATQGQSYPAPPVPPKDPNGDAVPIQSSFVPPQGRAPYAASTASSSPFPRDPAADQEEAASALHRERQRSLSVETEIQDRFRREKLGYGLPSTVPHNGERQVSDVDSEPAGLPYDREDHEPEALVAAQPGLSTLEEVQSSTSLSRAANAEDAEVMQAERLAVAAAAHAERVAAEREREEQERLREEQERERLESARVAELARVEEEARVEALRLQEEERVEAERRAEDERMQMERFEAEAARLKAEEEEKERVRAEHARLAEEERVRKEEAEKERIREQEEKKRQVTESLHNQHRQGGTMLSGWITVQVPRSMAWRRRWFKLQPTALDLFKLESQDASKMNSIPLTNGTKLSIRYEESQVKDSFKLVVPSSIPGSTEDYYLFADSPEDLSVILEGLRIILG